MLPSPCINVCRMEPASGLCAGCYRTLDEIAGWARSDEGTQRAILAAVAQRRASAGTARHAAPNGTS